MLRVLFNALSPAGPHARLSILIFHRVRTEPDRLFPDEPDRVRFDLQMQWVKRWFTVLPLEDAVRGLQTKSLPARALSITFDDGYADNATVALPILVQHKLHATFFVATGYLDGGCMWNDLVLETAQRAAGPFFDGTVLGLGSLPMRSVSERQQTARTLIEHMKYLPEPRRTELARHFARESDISPPDDIMLTTAQLKLLQAAGMSIGAHTVTHPILTHLDHSAATREIGDSKDRLEGILREPVKLFAYPNGKPERDYASEHVDIVRTMGFAAAVSTAWGVANSASDILQLPRFTPWDRSRLRYGIRCAQNLVRSTATVALTPQ